MQAWKVAKAEGQQGPCRLWGAVGEAAPGSSLDATPSLNGPSPPPQVTLGVGCALQGPGRRALWL